MKPVQTYPWPDYPDINRLDRAPDRFGRYLRLNPNGTGSAFLNGLFSTAPNIAQMRNLTGDETWQIETLTWTIVANQQAAPSIGGQVPWGLFDFGARAQLANGINLRIVRIDPQTFVQEELPLFTQGENVITQNQHFTRLGADVTYSYHVPGTGGGDPDVVMQARWDLRRVMGTPLVLRTNERLYCNLADDMVAPSCQVQTIVAHGKYLRPDFEAPWVPFVP